MDNNLHKIVKSISLSSGISEISITNTISLLEEGCTIPFISRYRKEKTGNLDDVQISFIKNEYERLKNLEQRRQTILNSINEQGKLTPELKEKILKAGTLSQLEDFYLPYKPKKKTKAAIAREKGLEPFALKILQDQPDDLEELYSEFLNNAENQISFQEVLSGAKDILSELISEEPELREAIRNYYHKHAVLKSRVIRGKEKEGIKFEQYFEWEEHLRTCPSHRMLAIRRGEKEGYLMMDIVVNNGELFDIIKKFFPSKPNASGKFLMECMEVAIERHLKTSMEAEMRLHYKEKADKEAVEVFAANLRELLMAPPLGMKRILAIDPGLRTGCKVVALDQTGRLLEDTVIYPHEPYYKKDEAEFILLALIARHKIEAIAIGNGTAGRETESFVRAIPELPKNIIVAMVNEAGASVYSASDVAREEFPDKDVTVRGAVSIGRRLADPLAELVKIDPKSIGVGQYQHDVDQTLLKNKLDEVVESCVNAVGVELNTASAELLSYVSGIGKSLAQNIVRHRNTFGPFSSRETLKQVEGMGPKKFEQCAGFLRIREGSNPLDASAVHPERYALVEKMADSLGCSVAELMQKPELAKKIDKQKFLDENTGLATLDDILKELEKPGRDPRKEFEVFSFDDTVKTLEDLREGMVLPGIVSNVTNFGAFVDVGVHQDGLVHVSELSDTYVDDPRKFVKPGQKVQVKVLEVDVERKRIALSMKQSGFDVKHARQPSQKIISVEHMDMKDALAELANKFNMKKR
ncbi:MAG: RNA-binding transcriptional accessory protein [Bacteroidia bacterium]|nr:RNA-binding transcriptional accessory protein [Bacteroidia bacterium]